MGRFYRTASAMPLDYMHSLNIPLMEKVVETNDSYITDELEQSTKLENMAGAFPYLQNDENRAKEITEGYSKKIDDITGAIRTDPANWRSKVGDIDNLSRELQNSYRTGEISKITGNYNKYKRVADVIDKQAEEYGKTGKGISGDRAKAYKNYFLSEFMRKNPEGTNYNSKTGEYGAIDVFDPMANIDIRKKLSDELDKMKTDGEIKITDQTTGSGQYFNKETKKWEGITPDKILRIVTDRLNDPQLMDYLKQDTQVGLINGVYDKDPNSDNYGKFITPYSYNKVPIASSEQSVIDQTKKQIAATKNPNARAALQEQLNSYTDSLNNRTKLDWNPNSYLAPIMRSVVDQYSSSKTETGNDLSANPIWSTKYTQSQENARTQAGIKSREGMQQKLFDHQKTMYDQKLFDDRVNKMIEWANPTQVRPKATTSTKKVANGKVVGSAANIPVNIPKTENKIVGQLYTSPFAYTAEDKHKLAPSLNDEISVHNNTIQQLDSTLNDLLQNHPDNKILIANTQNQIESNKARVASLEAHRENALQYAMDKWKDKGNNAEVPYVPYYEKVIRGYMSGQLRKDYETANNEFRKLEAIRQSKGTSGVPEYADTNQWMKTTYYPALHKKKTLENEYLGGQRIFESGLKDSMNEKLAKAAEETTNSATIVQTTDNQDKTIISMITASPSNYRIIDKNGKTTGLSFSQGTATTNTNNFKIIGAGATTGLEDKNIEISAKINGKDVIIVPKDDDGRLSTFLGGEFKKSTDKDIANLGRIITSPTASTIADMVTEMQMNTSSPYGARDAWTYRTIPNPANINETTQIRARSISTGQGKHKWEFQAISSDVKGIMSYGAKQGGGEYTLDKDRKITGYLPWPSSKHPDGIYENLEDILATIRGDQ